MNTGQPEFHQSQLTFTNCKMFLIIISLILLGPCDNTVADYEPPMECMPVQVTNFTPYLLDDSGQPVLVDNKLQFHTETNMQCMVPCNKTGTLMTITRSSIGYYAACIKDWLGWHIMVAGRHLWCVDNFGDPTYQKPYFNDRRQEWVIPVDILTHEPLNYLTFEWQK